MCDSVLPAHPIVSQVWCQMVNCNVRYAILSCHTRSVFLIRRERTLYVSREYKCRDCPQLAAFCHLLLAIADSDEHLPAPRIPKIWADNYQRVKLRREQKVGLIEACVC